MVCSANSFHSFLNFFIIATSFRHKENKQNNQQQKQPTQETAFNRHYSRNTVEKKTKQIQKQENKANIEFLTCHRVPWASFLSQKATYFTSFCINKNNRHHKLLPAGRPSREKGGGEKRESHMTSSHHLTMHMTLQHLTRQYTCTHAPTHAPTHTPTANHATNTHPHTRSL